MRDLDLFKISLDGEGVTLETVDPKVILELALQYVKALTSVADDEEVNLGLHGLRALQGSAVIAFGVDNVDGAQDCAHTVNELVRARTAPHYIAPLRTVLLGLAPGMELKVANQNWSESVLVVASSEVRREVVSARVRVIRAGGARPAIRVEDVIKGRRYTVLASDERQAQELAQYLYREIDIRAEVTRRPDGNFVDGRLLKYTPLDDRDPLEAWRAWFAPHDEEWTRISDDDLIGLIKP